MYWYMNNGIEDHQIDLNLRLESTPIHLPLRPIPLLQPPIGLFEVAVPEESFIGGEGGGVLMYLFQKMKLNS